MSPLVPPISLQKHASDIAIGLESALNTVVPEAWNDQFFEHTYEGPDDMPGHAKSALFGAGATVPLVESTLELGKDQV